MSTSQWMRLELGGRLDRSQLLRFRFDGQLYEGFSGDTLASALIANGVRVVGRSFKYHRPRGLLAAGVEEPNALVSLSCGATNLRATEIELYDGLDARAVNCWPNARWDVQAVVGIVGRYLPAGFYYKTFIWPRWSFYEWAIRRIAGLGRVSDTQDNSHYETRFSHCDVLIVGAGIAGLCAARAAAASGARVILCEQDTELGGRVLSDSTDLEGCPAETWLAGIAAHLRDQQETRVLLRTTAAGYFDHNAVVLVQRGRRPSDAQILWHLRAKRVILATGSIERPLVFPGNDRPGVMLASAVRTYAARYAALPGRDAVVFTNNDDAYQTADVLARLGARVEMIVDTRKEIPPQILAHVRASGFRTILGGAIIATRGRKALRSITARDSDGHVFTIEADLVAMSGGFNPNTNLHSQSGGSLLFDDLIAAFKPDAAKQNMRCAGAAAGIFDVGGCIDSGHEAGKSAVEELGFRSSIPRPLFGFDDKRSAHHIEACWSIEGQGKAFLDFQNDVAVDDVQLAIRENFAGVEHLKRYTTLGMGTDQGKTSNMNALAILGCLTGRSPQETGTTTSRFPFTPMPLGVFAGRARGELFRPLRRMPAHRWHELYGAKFDDYGGWMRPRFYTQSNERSDSAVQREARAVRSAVGIFDASPLGKIEVSGPDAARFLDRMYANRMSTLGIGKIRYGIMLNEEGVIIDDGVCTRLAEDQFLLGTTSQAANKIAGWLEEWLQCEWPQLRVLVAPITTAWGTIALAGPAARHVLGRACTDIAIDTDSFPHMSFQCTRAGGIPARLSRVSFTGETSFEISVRCSRARELWEHFINVGTSDGITPIGVEAWMLLRAEKGYFHVGVETDGTTIPHDVGWGHVLRREDDFVGRRSLTRSDATRDGRLQLVGLKTSGNSVLPIGAHVTTSDGKSDGYVTSSGFSPTLRRGIALGMVRNGQARQGEEVNLGAGGNSYRARIVERAAYDPKGDRLRG